MENSENISRAVDFHKNGKLYEAKEIYKFLLNRNPKKHRLYHLLGLVEYQQGNHHAAISCFQQAISISPSSAVYHKDLANCFKHLKKYDQAAVYYQKALCLAPRYPEAYYDKGIMHLAKGEFGPAIKCFKKAVAYNPAYTNAYINLAVALERKKKFPEAISNYLKALKLNPENELVYNNIGNLYRSLGKMASAIKVYQKAIALKPDFAQAHCNLGTTWWEMMRYQRAIEAFENTVKANPNWIKPYMLLGTLYQEKGKQDAALNWFEKVLTLNGNNALAHSGKGQSYYEKKNERDALCSFKRALKIDPELQSAYVGLIKVMRHSCTWSGLKKYSDKLDQLLAEALSRKKKVYETPFSNLIRHADAKVNYEISKAYNRSLIEKIKKYGIRFDFKGRALPESKIHIGYLSNNFRNHPTANLLMDVFKLHDRTRFKVSCYSYGPDDQSRQREFIKQNCDLFVDLYHLDDIDAAKKINENQVDILIDLACYLKDSRPEIAAFHPAPLQVRWLGLAGTTGTKFYEYLITDNIVTPENEAEFYSENFIYLPRCYQINSNLTFEIQKSSKKQWQLPSNHFVFCAFNAAYKIDASIFKCWLSILKRVRKSVLWLMVESDLAELNLRETAMDNGVDPERIVFAERLPREAHLQRLSCADLALDTCAVSGAATTSDALWVNVPVLTVKGRHFASRMSASILDAVGLSELVFKNLHDYEEKAVKLANDPADLSAIKKKLAHQGRSSQLFNTSAGVEMLQNAYKMIWNLHKEGKKPKMLKVYE